MLLWPLCCIAYCHLKAAATACTDPTTANYAVSTTTSTINIAITTHRTMIATPHHKLSPLKPPDQRRTTMKSIPSIQLINNLQNLLKIIHNSIVVCTIADTWVRAANTMQPPGLAT